MVRLGLLAAEARLHKISLCETIIESGSEARGKIISVKRGTLLQELTEMNPDRA